MEKFIIVDGNSLANRAFYAMPYLSNRNKQPSGAVFGFANLIVKLIVEQRPTYFAVAFDHARKTFRNEMYEAYKAKRKETPQDLLDQFPTIKQMLNIMGIKTFEFVGYEADDIIGTLAKQTEIEKILVSGDRDLLQLIDKKTSVWLTKKGVTDIEKYDENALFEKYGLKPEGIVELKSLMGDSSDNIPGVMGVGEKTALSLLHNYGDLEGVYNHIDEIGGKLQEKLLFGKESAFLSQKLARIKTDCQFDCSLESCKYIFPFTQKVRDFFEEWDFRSLVGRKDIFSEEVRAKNSDVKRTCLENLSQVKDLAQSCKNQFCIDIANMEFSLSATEVFYIKKEIDFFSPTIDLCDALKIFKSVFENSNIVKITNSSKSDIKLLNSLGIEFNNFFDIEIARYLLYAGLPKLPQAKVQDFIQLKDELQTKMDEEKVLNLYENLEIPLSKVLADMENEGFKLDESVLDELEEKYKSELETLTQKIYALAGEEFNINSPKQVANILFDKLGLKSFNNKKQSTSFAVLDDIRWQHEIVEYLISYRKLSKIVSTYINVYKKICETSGSVIHTTLNQTLTSTGRLSSSEPNMQNIPTRDEEGRVLRKIFVSKYNNGRIISADYNQIELRLLAILAKEQSMLDAYRHGVDIHAKTASEIFGVPVEKVTKEERRDAKAVNFGIIYGISDFGLSQNIKTSRNKAKNYIQNYFSKYPQIKTFMDSNINYAKEHGFIRSFFGRIRHIPELSSSNYQVRKFGERVAMNMPLQGTASDVIKMAMIEVSKEIERRHFKSHIILQIHDELIVDSPAEEVDQMKEILKTTMESVCDFELPLVVSVSDGKNLFECK